LVNTFSLEGLLEVLGVPDGKGTLGGLGETYSEDFVLVTEPSGTTTLDTSVGLNLTSDGVGTRINDTQLLVLAKGGQERTIIVPLNGLDDTTVVINGELLRSILNIPKLNLIVEGRGGQNVVGRGVEGDSTSFARVTVEDLDGVSHVLGETTFGDLPDLDSAVFGGSGKDVVIEWGESNIQNRTLVARDDWQLTELTCVLQRQDTDGTTTSSVPASSQEERVDSNVVGIPSILRQLDVVVRILGLGWGTKNVAILGTSDNLGHFECFD